ncbi:MAG: metalloregulator ArsR/SmtB family transcription factor, partial [Clostridia bacterium]|nr:metalloregulator ArsR/SmtB family transcription factor [Clostridia bacterium]
MSVALSLLKALADETRLAIVAELSSSDSYVEKLAENLSLTPATVCYHLKKMEKAGLVTCSRTQFYIVYSLNKGVFEKTLSDIVAPSLPKRDAADPYREKVISSFFRSGRLVSLPVQNKKREVVLSVIADKFESGREYSEREVNEIILAFHDDYCTVRRELVGFGFMERED